MIQTLLRRVSSLGTDGHIALFPHNVPFGTGTGNEGLASSIAATNGVASNLSVTLTTAPGGATTRTFELLVNGVASALTLTITGAATAGSDPTNTVSYNEGDHLVIRFSDTGGPVASGEVAWSMDLDSDTTVDSWFGGCYGTTVNTGEFSTLFGNDCSATLAVCDRVIAYPGTITKMFVGTMVAAFSIGAGVSLDVFLYLDGVKQDGTGGTVDTKTTIGPSVSGLATVSSPFSLPITRGQYVCVGYVETGTINQYIGVSVRFESSTAGVSLISALGGSDPNATSTRDHNPLGNAAIWAAAGAASASLLCGLTDVGLSYFILDRTVDPGSGNTQTFEAFVNGAAPGGGPGGVISTGVLQIDDTSGAVDLTTGDTVTLRHTPASSPTVTGSEYWGFAVYDVAIGTPTPPPGPPGPGGDAGTGTNPADGTIPTTFPLVFIYVLLGDGTILKWSEAWARLNDPAAWFDGEKENRIKSLSSIKTEFSIDGAPKTYTWTVGLSDTDGALRLAARTNTLKGAYIAAFVVDDSVRRALGAPYRFAGGNVITHEASEPMTMTLQCEGALGRKLAKLNTHPKVPNHVLTDAQYSGIDKRREGKTVHVALGIVSDETDPTPEGVMPWQYTATGDLQAFCGGGAVSVLVDCYLISMGALGFIYNSYFTIPVWGETEIAEVGDLIRPADDTPFYFVATSSGTTGTSEPTWPTSPGSVGDGSVTWTLVGALDTLTRYLLPASVYGTILVTPFKTGWDVATGLSTQFIDFGSPPRRFTPAFVLHTHRYARALREGRIQIASNGIGQTDDPGGAGLYFVDPVEISKFVLINEGFASIDYITHASIPTFTAPDGTYSIMDTVSAATATTVGTALYAPGIQGGTMLGRDGNQQRLFDWLREATIGGYFRLGENRNGQIIWHRHDPGATPVVYYHAWEILAGSVNCWLDDSNYANHVRSLSGYRYEPLMNAATTASSRWANAVIQDDDTAAQDPVTGVGEAVTYEIENFMVRDPATVSVLTTEIKDLRRGPAATMDGCPMMAFTTRFQGLGKIVASVTVPVDLGTCIAVTHPEARKPTTQAMIVEGREVDGLKGTVRLTCRVLEAVPPSE